MYDYVESKHIIEINSGKNDVDTIHTLPHVNTKNMYRGSVKCLSDYKRNVELNTSDVKAILKYLEGMYNSPPQPIDLGEKNKDPVPDPLRNNKDLLLEDIAKFKRNANRDDTPD